MRSPTLAEMDRLATLPLWDRPADEEETTADMHWMPFFLEPPYPEPDYEPPYAPCYMDHHDLAYTVLPGGAEVAIRHGEALQVFVLVDRHWDEEEGLVYVWESTDAWINGIHAYDDSDIQYLMDHVRHAALPLESIHES